MKPRWRIRKHREWWVVEDMQGKIVCYGATWRAAISWLEAAFAWLEEKYAKTA